MSERTYNYDIDDAIKNRWSTRAFDKTKPVPEDELLAIFEAARYAPSCFNEQPWQFIVSRDEVTRQKILHCLTEKNQAWAGNAPVLAVILAKQNFAYNNQQNRWHQFDTGTSWGYLSLEAERRGLITHAMAGISADKVREAFDVPDDISVIAGLAIGYSGGFNDLSESDQAREKPATRKPLENLFYPV